MVHYDIHGASGEDAPTIILSSGLGGSGAYWTPQIEALSEHFRVVTYDTRGHGESPAPEGPYVLDDLVDDLIALLDEVGAERAHVAGLSLARGVGRIPEMAIQAALGANRARIVRQLLAESVTIAVVSGGLGLLLAVAGMRVVRAFGPANLARLQEVGVDLRVLAWAAAALGYGTTQASTLVGVVAVGTAVGAVVASIIMRLEHATRVLPMGIAMGVLVVGMNDTLRSDFDPVLLRRRLDVVIGELTAAGAVVVTARYHDHGRVFRLPAPLRRALAVLRWHVLQWLEVERQRHHEAARVQLGAAQDAPEAVIGVLEGLVLRRFISHVRAAAHRDHPVKAQRLGRALQGGEAEEAWRIVGEDALEGLEGAAGIAPNPTCRSDCGI